MLGFTVAPTETRLMVDEWERQAWQAVMTEDDDDLVPLHRSFDRLLEVPLRHRKYVGSLTREDCD
jgi:hypothetical protein